MYAAHQFLKKASTVSRTSTKVWRCLLNVHIVLTIWYGGILCGEQSGPVFFQQLLYEISIPYLKHEVIFLNVVYILYISNQGIGQNFSLYSTGMSWQHLAHRTLFQATQFIRPWTSHENQPWLAWWWSSIMIIVIGCTLIWTYDTNVCMSQKPSTTSLRLSPWGILTYWASRWAGIAWQISTITFPTVDHPKRNSADNFLHLTLVASFQIVTATLSSTDTGDRKRATYQYHYGVWSMV